MKIPIAAAAAVASILTALTVVATAGAANVTFEVTNNASTTPGGQRFDRDYGVDHAKQVLSDASAFIWCTFNQSTDADRRPVDGAAVTLAVVDDTDGGIASTSGSTVELSARYVGGYSGGDLEAEVTGILYHEATHVWQWGLQDYEAHWWVFEGVADFVRLRAGYAPAHWVRPGQGSGWDKGYDVTARFLDYCESLRPGFVAEMNAGMKNRRYSDDFFVQILGKSVQQLWQDYKAKYGA